MNTIDQDAAVVAACQGPGVSVAAIALMHKLNANLLRRWLEKAESGATDRLQTSVCIQQSSYSKIVVAERSASVTTQMTEPVGKT